LRCCGGNPAGLSQGGSTRFAARPGVCVIRSDHLNKIRYNYTMPRAPADIVRELIQHRGYIRLRDAMEAGVHPEYVRRLTAAGELVQVARGLYTTPNFQPSEFHSLAIVSARARDGVVCLLSALRVHQIGTQNPRQIWFAIESKAARPRLTYPPLKIVRFSRAAMTFGIETRVIEGVTVRITDPARTVVDCFKYRNKIGLDVALEALRHLRRRKGWAPDTLWKYATSLRVANVIRPYLEGLA
jgi:predicted transcriptional regulator of viral defense system